MDSTRLSYEQIKTAADFVLSKISQKPLIGIVCGSGLGTLHEILENSKDISYEDIPECPKCSIQGHNSILTFGTCANIPIVCFRGRFHFYEGHPMEFVVFPVRLLKLLGAKMLILTNAAGGINKEYAKGDIMLIKDHFNIVGLAGRNPIKGADKEWGPTFFSIKYDKSILKKAREALTKIGYTGKIHEGVYACVAGPSYETISEVKMLRLWGTDAVGMSTAHEVVAAFHCGLKVLAFSMITNVCVDDYETDRQPNHEEVLETSEQYGDLLKSFFELFIANTGKEYLTNE